MHSLAFKRGMLDICIEKGRAVELNILCMVKIFHYRFK